MSYNYNYNEIYRITTSDSKFLGRSGYIIRPDLIQVLRIDSSDEHSTFFANIYIPIYDYEYIGSEDLLTYINQL